ncbi:hypothetical protein BZA05DRAFT_230803 [Tricharina praecox]|uniref:uncharacterized protein n=1 Tax=Tricharina praecox TaxID=43433 RepID=UPI00221EE65A|nr:uncharacterized protein BZA05DRAFT_230803 [Tricharina praecox]KAI5841212.1 hypothetical protein BZA05DRAFT_230803 [Tricharina praecox]
MASDHELDLEYRAAAAKSVRPTSTLARAFANQLNDIFLLDDQLDKLDQSVSRKKQSVSYQNSELALLEARIKQAEKLLEEKKQRLAGRSPTSSARSNVPDYAPNPAFSAIAKADEQTAEDGAEPKEGSAAQENGYQARPPPPPPSVPTNV